MRTSLFYIVFSLIFSCFSLVHAKDTIKIRALDENPNKIFESKAQRQLDHGNLATTQKSSIEADQAATQQTRTHIRILRKQHERESSKRGDDSQDFDDSDPFNPNNLDPELSSPSTLTALYGIPIALVIFCACFGRLWCHRRQYLRRHRNHHWIHQEDDRCVACLRRVFRRRSSTVRPQGIVLTVNRDPASPNNNGIVSIQPTKEDENVGKFKLKLKEVLTASEEDQCKICFAYKKNAVMFPCMHSICHKCLEKMAKCPFCRGEITDAKPLTKRPPKRQIKQEAA